MSAADIRFLQKALVIMIILVVITFIIQITRTIKSDNRSNTPVNLDTIVETNLQSTNTIKALKDSTNTQGSTELTGGCYRIQLKMLREAKMFIG